jgi:amino acid transporter
MTGESIAIYVNNIVSFAVFIIILAFIFALLILLSRFLTRRKLRRYNTGGADINGEENLPAPNLVKDYKKDPYLRNNAFILGTVFIIMIYFILLILAVLNYSINPSLNLNLFLIIGIVLYLLLMVIYIIKSEIIC